MNGAEEQFIAVEGGVSAPRGFVAAGVSCGIKSGGKEDLALFYSKREAAAAGAFTTNRVQAAPVKLSREHLTTGRCRAVIVNSGSANACTGERGEEDALTMARLAASGLGIEPESVAVCSTGRIGRRLPMEKIENGIRELTGLVRKGGNDRAPEAILTTDTRPKTLAVEFGLNGVPVRIGGTAKGAGMIYPKLRVAGLEHATMLAFIATDAGVESGLLRKTLSAAIEQSFNRVTVDGDTSTNDTVIVLANGASGMEVGPAGPARELFQAALNYLTRGLARMIAADGEGASKFVQIEVRSAATGAEAALAASAVANSSLFKSALWGETPNWGRIMAALGRSGAEFEESKVTVSLEGMEVVSGGLIASLPEDAVREKLKRKELRFVIELGAGRGSDVFYTCDLTPEYVEINKE